MATDPTTPTTPPAQSRPARPQGAPGAPGAGVRKPAPAGAKPAADEGGPLGRVLTRNEFYRDGYRLLLKVAFLEAIAILGLIISIVVIVNVYQPENRYFATTEDGRVVPMVALADPNLSRPALLSWVAQAATETMTFGFHDYRRRLQESSRHFTREGWASFVKALQDSGVIEAVEANRQVITAAPRAAPTILSEGVLDGVYHWQVEMPMMITYQYGQNQRDVSMNVRLMLVRVPKLESPSGVGIAQWVAYAGG